MKKLSDYGLMSFRASAIYFVIIQGFGYLMGLSYSAFQLFGITTAGVIVFNLWTFLEHRFKLPGFLSTCCGEHGFMDEREIEVATTAAAYGFVAAILAISLDQGQVYGLDLFQVGRITYAVFLGVFLGKAGYHRTGGNMG